MKQAHKNTLLLIFVVISNHFTCALMFFGQTLFPVLQIRTALSTISTYFPQETCTLMFKNPRMVKQPLRTEWCLGEDQDIPGQYNSQGVKMVKIVKKIKIVKMVKLIDFLFYIHQRL